MSLQRIAELKKQIRFIITEIVSLMKDYSKSNSAYKTQKRDFVSKERCPSMLNMFLNEMDVESGKLRRPKLKSRVESKLTSSIASDEVSITTTLKHLKRSKRQKLLFRQRKINAQAMTATLFSLPLHNYYDAIAIEGGGDDEEEAEDRSEHGKPSDDVIVGQVRGRRRARHLCG